ncbi:NtaA/DmoA family FMN-dependent monooxygenase [Homoserinibacter sp. YIM 151385]|uniref:NtaA/DmoA family FMN-dependent monooxygenase n=1 Tax=Homoserinibacter sp. YIM 151385 TaxID=2985506 RepID=UPI0022EFD8B6|nr:NtaA/DmoA family FMN-dependent monooxygenase [Homoserinibacter sp. YIM 151385]WBU36967.1 NtaA/DmoA family FMN-dependent monooxygenase [Homoserinibacter sp. YIM 151385]
MTKQLVANVFEMNTPGHITHGLWRQPDNQRERYTQIEYWIELARLAEAGGFDAIFLADVIGAYDVYDDDFAPAVRRGLQIPNNDPMLLIPAMAAVTEHIGFGVTFSTTYEPPFAFARRMSTLDHLTKGRVGWNIVTSYLPNAARNFGLAEEIEHDLRYEIAAEYMEVLYKLWEGSWDDDAVLVDKPGDLYADPSKVRRIDHVGRHFRVAGPHLSEPSPQRTPLLFQASASRAGIAFAAQHAEVLFTADRPAGALAANIASIREAAVAAGRRPDDTRFLVMATVIVGRTEEEARAKLERYRGYRDAEGAFVHMSVPFHPLQHPDDITVREALEREGRHDVVARGGLPLHLTVGAFRRAVDEAWDERFLAVGTPEQVADTIEHWLDVDGIDGINLRQYHSFETVRDFAELAAPELRRRGRLRESYRPGETLRERIFGEGARLPERHRAARYRGGAGL